MCQFVLIHPRRGVLSMTIFTSGICFQGLLFRSSYCVLMSLFLHNLVGSAIALLRQEVTSGPQLPSYPSPIAWPIWNVLFQSERSCLAQRRPPEEPRLHSSRGAAGVLLARSSPSGPRTGVRQGAGALWPGRHSCLGSRASFTQQSQIFLSTVAWLLRRNSRIQP